MGCKVVAEGVLVVELKAAVGYANPARERSVHVEFVVYPFSARVEEMSYG